MELYVEVVLPCLATETAFTTSKSKESDVYSYGVVLLELITRKKALDPSFPENTHIVRWVSSMLNGTDKIEVVADPDLMHEVVGSMEMEEVFQVLSLAMRCTAEEASERPLMWDVVKELMDIKSKACNFPKQGKYGSVVS